MNRTLLAITQKAKRANRKNRPLSPLTRQAVQVLYGGAHLFNAKTPEKLGMLAKKALLEHAPTPHELDRCLGLSPAHQIHERVLAKLEREAIEDLRIDFEDGYGVRSDTEEDRDAVRVATELAFALDARTMPPFFGIRVKSFANETVTRSFRTLELFLSQWVKKSGRGIPEDFVINLPKVANSAQVAVFVAALEQLEKKFKLARGSLKFEIMVELPELLLNARGVCELPLVEAKSQGRLKAAHFGIYDYLTACGVAASSQSLTHSACDHARSVMQMALSGTQVKLSNGATHVTPAGLDHAGVIETWRLSFENIRHELKQGFYQGWDLHPAQVPIRYAALYAFFSENLASSSRRMKNFLASSARASQSGQHFDDEASAQGLLNFFIRGYGCGALDGRALSEAGLNDRILKTRSFQELSLARD